MRKDILSLQEMVDCCRIHEDQKSYVSYLIDEIFYFKSFVYPHLLDDNSKIIGIKQCQFLKFKVFDNISVMQYKASLRYEN